MFVAESVNRRACLSIGKRTLFVATVGFVIAGASLQTTLAQDGASGVPAPSASATVDQLFADFLHYARIGHFTAADAYAKALLAHPSLDPIVVHDAALKDRKSVETLMIIVKNSTIGENAAKVLDLVKQGENAKRKNPESININIKRLGGDPQQELFAQENLAQSGEYAIPPMIRTLLDPADKALWPRVISAMPKVGKGAVNPLVMALNVENNDVRLHVIHSLGEIGYPQAIPYLLKIAGQEKLTAQVRDAAKAAVTRIEVLTGREQPGTADAHFFALADQYYQEFDAVRADPRLDVANVWYWDSKSQSLQATVVPTRIFGQVMAMRCSEEALSLRNDHAEAIALWLASNIRREGRLGMNVESGDPAEKGESDATRPAVFPRALYFTQAAGPLYAQLVLERAVRDADTSVALGAIEALRLTAGESSLFGMETGEPPLVAALKFPDLVVRIRAALALGAALPKSEFQGSPLVVPVLATALTQSGKEQVIVVDPDQTNLNRVVGAMRAGGREVIGEANLFRALERARVEFQATSGILVASSITDPDIAGGLRALRNEFLFSKTPLVMLTRKDQLAVAEELGRVDAYLERVDAAVDDAALTSALSRVRSRTKQATIDPKLALSMAIQSAQTLRQLAEDGRTVLNYEVAEPALIGALQSNSEELQTLCASVLALVRTPTAQRAVGHVAMDPKYSLTLRIAAFGSLAESGMVNGLQLEDAQIAELVRISREEKDLTIRTAASKALGAVNLRTNQASDIIRSYYGG